MGVEATVDGGGEDGDVRVFLVQHGEALGGGEQADEAELGDAGLAQAGQSGRGGMAGGEHGVDDDDEALRDVVGELEVVFDGDERGRVAVEADMADPGGRNEVEHAVEDAVAGTQDGDEAELLAREGRGLHRLERGVDGDHLEREVAGDLVGEQKAEFAGDLAEGGGGGLLTP